MKSFYAQATLLLLVLLLSTSFKSNGQCSGYETVLTDGFEYTSICPDIIPGMVIHNTPQQYGVRSGAYALYLNMIDCNGGTGCCVGDSIYIKTLNCCPGQPIRFSFWVKTIFAGGLCNIRVAITDGNDNVLDNTPAVSAPLANWVKFTSAAVIPGTFVVKLKIYTNVDGGNGNDLGIDDMIIEKCAANSLTNVTACNNEPSINLLTSTPPTAVNTGTWAGPSILTGGYLGTYTPGVNTAGYYSYTSDKYGTGGLCPTVIDSINVTNSAAPTPQLGNDTTVCINQPFPLAPGTSPNYTYQWSNFATTSTINAYSGAVTTNTYAVTVTSPNGCIGRDSIHLSFAVCSGISENSSEHFSIFPNPTKNILNIQNKQGLMTNMQLGLTGIDGKEVFRTQLIGTEQTLELPVLSNGVYFYTVIQLDEIIAKGKLLINN